MGKNSEQRLDFYILHFRFLSSIKRIEITFPKKSPLLVDIDFMQTETCFNHINSYLLDCHKVKESSLVFGLTLFIVQNNISLCTNTCT